MKRVDSYYWTKEEAEAALKWYENHYQSVFLKISESDMHGGSWNLYGNYYGLD
jgi:hypothetical protein